MAGHLGTFLQVGRVNGITGNFVTCAIGIGKWSCSHLTPTYLWECVWYIVFCLICYMWWCVSCIVFFFIIFWLVCYMWCVCILNGRYLKWLRFQLLYILGKKIASCSRASLASLMDLSFFCCLCNAIVFISLIFQGFISLSNGVVFLLLPVQFHFVCLRAHLFSQSQHYIIIYCVHSL